MPTPQEIRDAIDARLAGALSALRTRQTAHKTVRGVFFQALLTHAVDPADGAATAPDRLDTRPHYQAATTRQALGAALVSALGSLPMSMSIHQYVGPQGLGWIAYLRVTIAGRTWTRALDNGPEGRSEPWARMDADAIGGVA